MNERECVEKESVNQFVINNCEARHVRKMSLSRYRIIFPTCHRRRVLLEFLLLLLLCNLEQITYESDNKNPIVFMLCM